MAHMRRECGAGRDRADIERPIQPEIGRAQLVRRIARLHVVDAGEAEILHRRMMHVPENSEDRGDDERDRR